MFRPSSDNARVTVEAFHGNAEINDAVVSFCRGASPAILETSLRGGPYGRFTILACEPCDLFCLEANRSADPFEALAEYIAGRPAVEPPPHGLPFAGAWIGCLSYEAGLAIEQIRRTTRCDVGLPVVRFALYDSAAIFDHAKGRWHLVAVDWPDGVFGDRPSATRRLDALRELMQRAVDRSANPETKELHRSEVATREVSPAAAAAASNRSREDYLSAVGRAKRYIEAGDIYQVNLSRRFTTRTHASPLAIYQRLRRESPSSHAALLIWDDKAVISSSPELFLELRNGHVVTRPIKGTRPRGFDAAADASYRRELIESEKDRAELNMIVDLLRNDLGRVCRFGSVRVADPGGIERHPTVFHRVATITGTLDSACNRFDLLRAAFPGGSITGAPKIRAMEIIDELEPTERGVYCGSIGMIGLDGSLSLNIAIRTMVQVGEVVHWHAGGAIVADSDPEAEHEELLAKAAAMTRVAAMARAVPTSQGATID